MSALATEPLGVPGSLRAARRTVAELIPEPAIGDSLFVAEGG
ncbi:MAG: hypothetical protein U1D35_12170 [Paracoccaceae bacterium]|nr:hypothetical protein [Paracoccaceae bacterium]